MRWLTGFVFAAALTSAEREIVPIDVKLEITGYRIEGTLGVVVVRATNQEQVPISYWSERIEHPFIRVSWQENEIWVDQKIWMCGVGSREQILAAGEQREFTWAIGSSRKDAATGSVSWSWVPIAWPIRACMRFCRPASQDWWDVMSETSDIDETLRSVMLQAVTVQGVPMVPVQVGAEVHDRPAGRVLTITAAARVAQ